MIDGEEVNHTELVNVNEKFNLLIRLVDRITRLPLATVQWSNWTWQANVTIYPLTKFNRPGSLRFSSNTTVLVDRTRNLIEINDMIINVTGMYVLNLRLMSTNQEHSFTILSKAILITDDLGKLEEDDVQR